MSVNRVRPRHTVKATLLPKTNLTDLGCRGYNCWFGSGVSGAMRRREFIRLVGGAAVAVPVGARAQQAGMPVIGFLNTGSLDSYMSQVKVFHQTLKETGYVEGQNVAIEYRWAENQIDRLSALADDLVRRKVSVIAAGGSPASALAAKSATTTIPIVFINAADPVEIGLVASFNRPGGNITGATLLSAELVAKRLGILRDLLPSVKKIAMLVNPTRPGVETQKVQVQGAAQALGWSLHILEASSERILTQFLAQCCESRRARSWWPPTHCFSTGAQRSPI